MKKNILILDDEVNASDYLKESIEEYIQNDNTFNEYKVETSNNYQNFMEKIETLEPAIIFLDIEMPNKNGLEVAQIVNDRYEKNSKEMPIIVFCTAYEDYGYKAFKVNAFDYLLKPVSEEPIANLFNKIKETFQGKLGDIEEYVISNNNGIDVKIPLKKILYFNANMKYISVITHEKEFLLNETLINLEKKYPSFVKTHRAFLANPLYFQKVFKRNNQCLLKLKNHETPIPISRRQRQELNLRIVYSTLFNDFDDSDLD